MEEKNIPSLDKSVHGPKALFWYLTLFFTLGITAFNTGGIWFQYINKLFPLEVSYGYVVGSFSQTALKFAIASILIATPLFFLVSFVVRKALKNGNLDPKNKVRTWITYIILFITIAIAIGDLITTVFRVLDGDFTARFLLKSFTILFIVSWIFVYYWLELKSVDSLVKSNLPKIIGIISVVIIIASFIGAFFLIDSPTQTRSKAYDQTKINDIQNIKYAIDSYYIENDKLPESLASLTQDQPFINIADPKTNEEYEYSVTSERSYEICAVFETSNKDQIGKRTNEPFNVYAYDQGRNCFTEKVNIEALKGVPLPR